MEFFFFLIAALVLAAAWLRNRRKGGASPVADSRPVSTPLIELQGDGSFEFEIVGESFYQDALERLAGGRTEDGAEVEAVALLVPELTNPHDRNAVAVRILGYTVGYLSRSDALRYREACGVMPARCAALIVGGWDRGPDDQGHFGVKLDLKDVA